MKAGINKAYTIFKYLSILFMIAYWVYVIIGDYVLIKEYWNTNWLEYLEIWFLYFIVYILGFSLYYWLISMIVILIYFKLIKKHQVKRTPDGTRKNHFS